MRLLVIVNGVVVVVGGGVGSGRDRKVILGITWGIWVWLLRFRGAASHFLFFFSSPEENERTNERTNERMNCESFASC